MAIAADFPRIAREATGAEFRALVAPWLGGATFNKYTRELVLRVHTVPVSLLSDRRMAEYHDSKDQVVVRRVILRNRRSAA